MPHNEIVWILEDRTFGYLLNYGAYCSLIAYTKDGTDYEVLLENDEWELWEDGIDYERE